MQITENEQARLHKRTLIVVIISQILGGAGLAAGISVGALLAQEMLGSDSLTGLPTGLFTLGSALTAFLVGRSSNKWGRRIGLAAGFAAGGLGAIGVVTSAVFGSVPLLFISLFVYGAGTATNLQARYAGADLATHKNRGTSISMAMVFTTVGAVAGPNLIEPTGVVATALGLPALTGPFLLAGISYLAAGLCLWIFLRPDPLLTAKAIASATGEQTQEPISSQDAPTASQNLSRSVFVGATMMVLTQIAMVGIMTMTPVHMKAHHHGLGAVGLVIGLHIAAMYLPSLITGKLVDKVGRIPMAVAAGVTLLTAGVVGAYAPGDSLGLLILALVLLGLGWNFGLIAGTTLIVDATTPQTRAKVQGNVDVLIAFAGASGGAVSGVVMAASSFQIMSLAGGVLALLLLPVLFWSKGK